MVTLEQKIKNASKYHKVFQGLVGFLANQRSGVIIDENFLPRLIFKYEGGVVCNGEEIVISFDKFENSIYCYDDYNDKNKKEPEIVKKVVEDLLEIDWKLENPIELSEKCIDKLAEEIKLDKEVLFSNLCKFCQNPFGDPLRSLFNF